MSLEIIVLILNSQPYLNGNENETPMKFSVKKRIIKHWYVVIKREGKRGIALLL